MFCKNCGKEIAEGIKFCPGCGTAVSETESRPQPVSAHSSRIALVIVLVAVVGAAAGIAFYLSPGQQYKRVMNKGDAFMSEDAYSDAVLCYQNALDIRESKDAEKALVKAYIKYAEECAEKANYSEAIDNYLNALDMDDDNDDALEGILAAYIGFGNQQLESRAYDRAEEQFENALDLDENCEDAKSGLLSCYVGFGKQAADKGDFDKAVEYFDEVLIEEPDNASAYCGKAHVTALQGNVVGAMELLDECLAWNEDNSELLKEREYLIANAVVAAKDSEWNDGSYSHEEYNAENIVVKSERHNTRGILVYESAFDDGGNPLWAKYYDDKGKLTAEETYEYNEKGMLLRYTHERMDYPEDSYRTEYEYDSNGNCIKQSDYSNSGQLTNLSIYEYDEKNQNTLYAYYYYYFANPEDSKASYSSWESNKYTYDDHGNRATYVYISGYQAEDGTTYEDSYSESYAREYDADGNETACTFTDSYGGTDNTITTYDSRGNVLKREHYYDDDGIMDENEYRDVTEYEYFEDGTQSRYWYGEYNNENELCSETEYFYDESGNTISYRYETNDYYYYSGDTYSYHEYEYDEHGNMTKGTYNDNYERTVSEYEYTYDVFGNLIRRYDGRDGTTINYKYEYRLAQ